MFSHPATLASNYLAISYTPFTLQKPKASLYIPPFTGIRAIAAYLVFFHHYNPTFSLKSTNKVAAFVDPIFEGGHIGVNIFFVLSGLLITLRYYERLNLSASWFFGYLRNRFARIYPLYFIITCLTFLFISIDPVYALSGPTLLFGGSKMPFMIMANLTLTKGFFDALKFTGIPQGWTLTVEETFYLSAPLLLLGLRRNKTLIFIYPFLITLIGICLYFIGAEPLHYLVDNLRFFFGYTFFGRCFEFFCGMFLGVQLIKRPHFGLRYSTTLTYGGILWIVCCIYAIGYAKGVALVYTDTFLGVLINNIILPIGVSGFLLGLAKGQTVVGRFLSTKLMKLLGQSSYAFYLIHMGFLNVLIDQLIKSNYLLNFLIINGVSILLFKFIEEPLHKKLRKS